MNWPAYFFNLVEVIKQKSKDPSTQVGCIIVGKNNEVISTGFNGLPKFVFEKAERYIRPNKYLYIEHSERNAIYLAARRGVSLEGASIYVPWHPCADCARAIIQAGISKVYIDGNKYDPLHPTETDLRWKDSIEAAKEMLDEAWIDVIIWKEN